ncbi:MAG: hypothetical protein EOO27_47940, partial [Comamonadaceae bacterium]
MNRKLRKLFRNPGKFLLDSRLFGARRPAQDRASAAQSTAGEVSPKPPEFVLSSRAFEPADGSTKELQFVMGTLLSSVQGDPLEAVAAPDSRIVAPARAKVRKVKVAAAPRLKIEGYEGFDLRGPNWLDGTEKSVAVLWGFATWQRGFVAQYLPEHRVAFVNARTTWQRIEASLDRLEGLRFIFWGTAGHEAAQDYAKRRGIATGRMGDGFIRSVSRASDKSLPYSMVLDEVDSSANTAQATGLEALLSSHDFATSRPVLRSVPALLELHRALGISKYNHASFGSAARLLGPKMARRVLVVGEAPHLSEANLAAPDAW